VPSYVAGARTAAAGGRPQAGLEVVEELLTAMIRVVFSGAGLTRRLTGQLP
jgi:hypothetical protein